MFGLFKRANNANTHKMVVATQQIIERLAKEKYSNDKDIEYHKKMVAQYEEKGAILHNLIFKLGGVNK